MRPPGKQLEYDRKWRSRPGVKERLSEQAKRRRAALRAVVDEWKEQGCALCGLKDVVVMEAHHRDPSSKDFNIGSTANGSIARIKAELEKCVCLCANCHRRLHYGDRSSRQSTGL